jgi:unsaturated chondroitin disaccharide hydrolase
VALRIDHRLTARALVHRIERLFDLSGQKILSLEKSWEPARGAPVVTVRGKYTSRAWTEWTQGFQAGSALLQFDATGERRFLEIGRRKTVQCMASHVSHIGVHDHGFNNISTYGNLWRLMREGKIPFNEWEKGFYELALKVSGAVQAARWSNTADGGGYIYSFNGPHSLFVDTVRSLRSLAVAHQLGHALRGERDVCISLLDRLLVHAETTALYCVYYGKGRDAFDVRGRTAHECIFNVNDGSFRCPNTQQGYSPFSTWTRGLAWGLLGFAEQLEFLGKANLPGAGQTARSAASRVSKPASRRVAVPTWKSAIRQAWKPVLPLFLEAARATADFYVANSCADGIPMWDTGAPNLHRLGNYLSKPADPFNRWEPVDSSAAAIAAQGLVRLGNHLSGRGDQKNGERYRQAGLTVARTLFDEPYLSSDPKHQGLLLHSVYHRPNGWDYVAPGQKVPNGESSMWGDYHARELALLLLREARCEKYPAFFAASA